VTEGAEQPRMLEELEVAEVLWMPGVGDILQEPEMGAARELEAYSLPGVLMAANAKAAAASRMLQEGAVHYLWQKMVEGQPQEHPSLA
jgi:hypothetical protein